MFGTIGHARLKEGMETDLAEQMKIWDELIRPMISGPVVRYAGHKVGESRDLVFMMLVQDEQTYRTLAASPQQDQWFNSFTALIDDDVSWEDVEMEQQI